MSLFIQPALTAINPTANISAKPTTACLSAENYRPRRGRNAVITDIRSATIKTGPKDRSACHSSCIGRVWDPLLIAATM